MKLILSTFIALTIAISPAICQIKNKSKPGKVTNGYLINTENKKVKCRLVIPYDSDALISVKTVNSAGKKKKNFTSTIRGFGYYTAKSKEIVYKLKRIPSSKVSVTSRKQFCRVYSEGKLNLYSFSTLNPVDRRPNSFRRVFFIEYGSEKATALKPKEFKKLLRKAMSRENVSMPNLRHTSDKIIDYVKKVNGK